MREIRSRLMGVGFTMAHEPGERETNLGPSVQRTSPSWRGVRACDVAPAAHGAEIAPGTPSTPGGGAAASTVAAPAAAVAASAELRLQAVLRAHLVDLLRPVLEDVVDSITSGHLRSVRCGHLRSLDVPTQCPVQLAFRSENSLRRIASRRRLRPASEDDNASRSRQRLYHRYVSRSTVEAGLL